LAQGREHDRATALVSLPVGLGTALLLNWPSGLIAAAAFSFGGLWLSPDLDTRCRALQRWGTLAIHLVALSPPHPPSIPALPRTTDWNMPAADAVVPLGKCAVRSDAPDHDRSVVAKPSTFGARPTRIK
jgi:hypothetical protein